MAVCPRIWRMRNVGVNVGDGLELAERLAGVEVAFETAVSGWLSQVFIVLLGRHVLLATLILVIPSLKRLPKRRFDRAHCWLFKSVSIYQQE